MDRRSFVKSGSLAALATSSLAACSTPSGRVFSDGDVVNVNGARIEFNRWRADVYGTMNFGESIDVTALHPNDRPYTMNMASIGGSSPNGLHEIRNNDNSGYRITSRPSRQSDLATVVVEHSEGVDVLPFRLVSHKPDNLEGYERTGVYSESPLDQSTLNSLQVLFRSFNQFGWAYPIFLYDHSDDPMKEAMQFSIYADHDYRAVIATTHMLAENVDGVPSELPVFHELVHSIVDGMIRDYHDQRPNVHLFQAYERWANAGGQEVPVPRQSGLERLFGIVPTQEQNPVLALFDESTYLPPIDFVNLGHPYRDHHEFVAGLMTTVRFYPEEVASNLANLPPDAKPHVRLAMGDVFDVFRDAGGEEALTQLLPQYQNVLQAAE